MFKNLKGALPRRRATSRGKIPFPIWWILLTLLYCGVFTTVEFIGSPVSGLSGFMNLAVQYCVVMFATSGIIGLISVNRYVFALTFPLLTSTSTVLSYYKLVMDVSFTPMMVEVALINDLKTWLTVIDTHLIFWFMLSLSLSIAIVVLRFRILKPSGLTASAIHLLLSILIILIPLKIVERFRMPVTNRMPYSLFEVTRQYFENRKAIAVQRDAFDGVSVTSTADAPDVVVVLGEALRSDHLGINGYRRQTTPLLAKETDLVSFPNVYSDYIFTHLSIPHIVTRADSVNPDIAYSEPSFISLFNKAGYESQWISNQDNVNSYVYFLHEADSLVYSNAAKSLYDFSSWYDADLLLHISRALQEGKGSKLLVIHSIGSHWWYKSHYPDSLAVFKPELDSRILSELTDEQIINSYDNTVIATDRFIADIIAMLRERNAILIYISDHGESLGENGNYLHKGDSPELHNPACFVWWSESYANAFPDKVRALRQNKDRRWRTDAIFHSVVDGAGLETAVLDRNQSLFHHED